MTLPQGPSPTTLSKAATWSLDYTLVHFNLLHTMYCYCEHFIYVFNYFQSSPLDCRLHLSREGCSWLHAPHPAQCMPRSKVFLKYLLNECELLLLCSHLTWYISSISAVGLDAPEKLRRVSLMALEGGRRTSDPFLGQHGVCCLLPAS